MKANALDKIAYVLLIIGGVNWGLVGWVKYNLVDSIFGAGSTGSRVVYAIVGLASLYAIYSIIKMMGKPSGKTA